MKIVALNGMLGYGYNEAALHRAFEVASPDYLGVDAGSIDPGPYYLGSGKPFVGREAVKRDLAMALPLTLGRRVPFIIGTAGGSGSNVHLEWLRDIILELSGEIGFKFKMGLIYTDVEKDYLIDKLRKGKVIPMGPQLKLDVQEISKCTRMVSQVGADPIIRMLRNGMDVIIAGRACDTAIYAAPCIMNGYDPGLSYHMAKIMECGAMCSEPVTAADVMQGYIEKGTDEHKEYFELEPANPAGRCTVQRVAAHTMYEQANPYMIYEPDGVVDLEKATYEQVNERVVRVRNSKFTKARTGTLKIEGVKLAGYRTICIGGINDFQTAVRIDSLFEKAKAFTSDIMRGKLNEDDYSVSLRKYGFPTDRPHNDSTGSLPGCNIGIIIDVVAGTQEAADTICAQTRSRLLHLDYKADEYGPGRKSTAGNIAFPFSPSDIPVGKVYEFNIYHLVEVDDLSETCRFEYFRVNGDKCNKIEAMK